ncbi:MAG: hypothetical protein PHU33_09715 [Bacteroidales bacterium]|nr:hypothetical protein [Bacteroidales bacterium]
MNHALRKIKIFIFLFTSLWFVLSCVEKKAESPSLEDKADKKQKNINFLSTLSVNIHKEDSVLVSFGVFGSLSNCFFNATMRKRNETIVMETTGYRDGEKLIMLLGKADYGSKLFSDSLSFEHLFCKILNDSSIRLEKSANDKRIFTIISNRSNRIDIYIKKESPLNEYINNYVYHLIMFYYPDNLLIPEIITQSDSI